MTTRQPRRTRRRQAPATTLPRPLPSGESEAASSRAPRHTTGHRTHHVTTDYRYVKKDLWHILAFGSVCTAFIVGMALYIS